MPADLPPWIKRGAEVAAVNAKQDWYWPVRITTIGAKYISTEEEMRSGSSIKDRYSRETLKRSVAGFYAPDPRTLMSMDDPIVKAISAKKRRGETKNALGPLLHQWNESGDPALLRKMIDRLSAHLDDVQPVATHAADGKSRVRDLETDDIATVPVGPKLEQWRRVRITHAQTTGDVRLIEGQDETGKPFREHLPADTEVTYLGRWYPGAPW